MDISMAIAAVYISIRKRTERLDKRYYSDSKSNKNIQNDIEKFGRETYLMTKNDEDLFIIAVE
jgi:hypothetical protein